jgi:uncharacterized protein YecA (UPF0149 family)
MASLIIRSNQMSRKPVHPKPPKPQNRKPLPPNLPQHNFPAPYSRLPGIGDRDVPALYDEIAAELRQGDADAAAKQLLAMALDESYYDYYDPDDPNYQRETRGWTRLHALRVLMRLGDAAHLAIAPLLPLLAEEDDSLREEMPFFYAAMGKAAIAPLTRQLLDAEADTFERSGAGDSLQEMAEARPELRDEILPILEQALTIETEDDALAAFLVCNLLDIKAKESLPIIEKAFEEERVDETIVQMADVEEHFDLPRVTPPKRVFFTKEGDDIALPIDEWHEARRQAGLTAEEDEEEEEIAVPYVAPPKVGRNDPCPCGSGKKYKKCHGA